MELAAADFLPVDILLETVSPVNAQETHHRQEDTHAHAGGTLHVEGVEVLNICPGITAFEEGEGVDAGGGLHHHGVTQLKRHAAISVSVAAGTAGKRTVVVTAQGDGLGGVAGGVARRAVAAHIERLKGRFLVTVVRAEDTEFYARHQDGGLRDAHQAGERAELKLPLVVFNPAILLLRLCQIVGTLIVGGEVLIVLAVPKRVRRGGGHGEQKLGTLGGEEGVVG